MSEQMSGADVMALVEAARRQAREGNEQTFEKVQRATVDLVMDAITTPNDVETVTTFNVKPDTRLLSGDLLMAVQVRVTRFAPDESGTQEPPHVVVKGHVRPPGRNPIWEVLPLELARKLLGPAVGI